MFPFSRSSSPNPGPPRLFLYLEAALLLLLSLSLLSTYTKRYPLFNQAGSSLSQVETEKDDNFIKWVDFTVTSEAMNKAFRMDLDTCLSEPHLNWIELLAYLGARYGGDFSR